ncbi:cyclic nucleotide-binding domain-containing protein [Rhodoferax sp.]|uniref:cyclic nucleotide-binding domain-containing protein n=1 Tax=Rhodoferax sp. TaxID=50421 RepID=UPI0025CBB7C6|nr:cyclic nucleotide-binding domain-containing protein [Rhodoferax sp.]
MNHAELARRLGATTLFSRLPKEQLVALLAGTPRRQAAAGGYLSDTDNGLKNHLVLLSGELEARRTWIEADGSQNTFAWRVGVSASGPGFSLLSAASSHTRVQALADSEYLSIDGDELDELLDWSSLVGNITMARHLKVFHKVPLENVQKAFERMVERPVVAGETIVTQGEPGDSYFIILSGEAEVWITDPLSDETTMVAVLGDADAFGEEALLLGGSRTATVRMNTPGRLLVLKKTDFDELLKPNMVEEVSAERANTLLREGSVKLLDCRYDMEYEESRIPGAQWVPLNTLRRQGVFTIDPEPTYIVYCRSGRRSSAAAFLLRERGIRALSLAGGIKDWPYEVDNTAL